MDAGALYLGPGGSGCGAEGAAAALQAVALLGGTENPCFGGLSFGEKSK